ncbi:hypothetical protein LTR28_003366, partial [Elasticomyces elasticus]
MSVVGILSIYIFGGLTFLPLTILLVFSYAYFTLPVRLTEEISEKEPLSREGEQRDVPDVLPESIKSPVHEPDVAAAYFAVCREFIPGGLNGKPPERTTPAGTVVTPEGPSVYQSMYRSIFDRGKSQAPTLESERKDNKTAKKVRNVFFVVLRHGHLMLYDDAEQLDVRHVISLGNHTVDVYAGGEAIPEGDLWIKRNCIRLVRKHTIEDISGAGTRPFYFFSDNCSEKEDFYHALLSSQRLASEGQEQEDMPAAQQFEPAHIIKLVQQLHASESNLQTRWLNAFVGRLFLAVYKTSEVEQFIRTKINKKISRVPKPTFISSISIREIDLGDAAPTMTNLKLKEMSIDGDLTIEADVSYNGNFRIEIAAIARIDLGTRFKAREVDLILSGVLKRLNGHILIRIKPPPSNRLWITFETMPKLELSIEPIVSSRHITYGIILRAIESRIREVVAETIVMPNWDDAPFLDTSASPVRGGIWVRKQPRSRPAEDLVGASGKEVTAEVEHDLRGTDHDGDPSSAENPLTRRGRPTSSATMPASGSSSPQPGLRKRTKHSVAPLDEPTIHDSNIAATSPGSPLPRASTGKPRTMRSRSFASAALPVVTMDGVTATETSKRGIVDPKAQRNAVDTVREMATRSVPASEPASPVQRPAEYAQDAAPASIGDKDRDNPLSHPDISTLMLDHEPPVLPRSPSIESHTSQFDTSTIDAAARSSSPLPPRTTTPRGPGTASNTDKRGSLPSTLTSATAAAKKWSLGVMNRTQQPPDSSATAAAAASTTAPMGRGQPLPPPGTPLPGPATKSLWASSPLHSLKRKPIPPTTAAPSPSLPARPRAVERERVAEVRGRGRMEQAGPPPLPARRRRGEG